MPGLDCRRLQDRIVRAERRMLPADGWCRPCLAAEVRGLSSAVVVAVAPISATPGWQRGLAVLAVHRGVEACRGVRLRTSLSVTGWPAGRSSSSPVRPSSTSLRVERLQLCVSPRCRAWTAADCRTGLSELNAGCCQRTGGAAPALRRKYEAIAPQLLLQ